MLRDRDDAADCVQDAFCTGSMPSVPVSPVAPDVAAGAVGHAVDVTWS
jgi:hypothetical protein